MIDSPKVVELSEAQRHAIAIRAEIAYASVQVAARLFEEQARLKNEIDDLRKPSKRYWVIAFLLVGTLVHFAIAGNEWRLTIGTWIAAFAVYYWYITNDHADRLVEKRDVVGWQLLDIDRTFGVLTGGQSVQQAKPFADFIDLDNEPFCDWWGGIRRQIVQRVMIY